MKVVVIGANGQLGSDLAKTMNDWNLIPLTHADVDIGDFIRIWKILTEAEPDVVINTAAFHRVDECEDQPEKAFGVNTYAVRKLAQFCAELGCVLVHMS